MNMNRQMEVHFINTGFPYSVTESFMDFFEGLTHVPLPYDHTGPVHDQENAYWTININMNAYKYGFSGPGSTSYYSPYEINDNLPRMDVDRGAWEYPSVGNVEEPTTADIQSEGDTVGSMHTPPEECMTNHSSSNSPLGVWQDDINLDNMTYEELLDLGETVGAESRGLSQELIGLLPTSKCKFRSFFSRRKAQESRCVICQMRYKRGDKQMKLPCRHIYHSECISKWLGINKVCPVCNNEVFVEKSKH